MADMMAKGRRVQGVATVHWTKLYPEKVKRGADHHLAKDTSCLPRGSAHPATRISEDDVRAIRASAETLAVLGERYGMTRSAISAIRNRKVWRHVL
jgi:hypothetical protein